MTTRFSLPVGDLLFALLSLTPSGIAAYAWWKWKAGFALRTLPSWRQTLAIIGISMVTLHALLFMVFWLEINSNPTSLVYKAYSLHPIFLVAVPCVLAGRGASRWLLISSSLLLFAMYHFLIFLSY